MEEQIKLLVLEYLEKEYSDKNLSNYDKDQILQGVFINIEEYIEQFVN